MSPYWKCQLIGWSLYGLMGIGIPTLYGGLSWPVVARGVIGAIIGVLLTHGLRAHIRKSGWLRLPIRRVAPRVFVATAILATLMVASLLPLLFLIIPPPDRRGPLMAILFGHGGVILGWIAIYLGYHHLHGRRAAEAERWRLEIARRDAELRALRAQLNPHFLFNSLNSFRALVTEDPARAQDAITGLASLLRYTLRLSRAQTVTVEQELGATRHYLELEALRFESRLTYTIEVEPELLEYQIPPLLIQTLAENAITHGIAHVPEGGVVRIEVWKPDDDLRIRVVNTGSFTGRRHNGVGLVNTLEQLRLVFGDRVRLDLFESAPNEVTSEVVVPSPALTWSSEHRAAVVT
jgi:two-component system, LytTR family, sensor kinase